MKPGYQGKDPMRENAEKAFGGALRDVMKPDRMSASEPQKIPMRLYKKGGKVKHYNEGGAMPTMGASSSMVTQPFKEKSVMMKRGGKTKFNDDGEITNPLHPKTQSHSYSATPYMKRGGKAKKHHEHEMREKEEKRHHKKHHEHEMHMGGMSAMKKGGKVKKMAMGGLYNLPNMAPPGPIGLARMKEQNANMKKGGKVKKMAMGGVGKIRHGQATKSGKQIVSRKHDSHKFL